MKFKLEANCIIEAEDAAKACNKLRLYFAQLGAEFQGIGSGPEEERQGIRLIPLADHPEPEPKKR